MSGAWTEESGKFPTLKQVEDLLRIELGGELPKDYEAEKMDHGNHLEFTVGGRNRMRGVYCHLVPAANSDSPDYRKPFVRSDDTPAEFAKRFASAIREHYLEHTDG
jgi:hypothetical protein